LQSAYAPPLPLRDWVPLVSARCREGQRSSVLLVTEADHALATLRPAARSTRRCW